MGLGIGFSLHLHPYFHLQLQGKLGASYLKFSF
jgi:hypothetical protein